MSATQARFDADVICIVLWLSLTRQRAQLTTNRVVVVTAFWLFLFCVLLSERVYPPGLWDAAEYIAYAQNFPKLLFGGEFAINGAARWGPSALCWLISRVLFIPLTDMNIMWMFEAMVVVWATTGALLWVRIASILGVRDTGKWLGLILLYVNFAWLKYHVYVPILTDATAFTIALAQLYFYLSKRPWALVGATLCGAFTFPGLEMIGFLLYALPSEPLQPLATHAAASGIRGWIISRSNVFIAAALALATAFFVSVASLRPAKEYLGNEWLLYTFRDLLPLSIAFAALYVYLAAAWLLRCQWWAPLYRLNIPRIVLGAALLAGIWVIRLSIGHGHSLAGESLGFEPNPYLSFPVELFRRPAIFPLSFSLGALMHFGLGVLFIYAYWNAATKIIWTCGLPIVLIAGMAAFMHLETSSRHATQVYPIMMVFAVAAADMTLRRWTALVPIVLVALLQSRVWASFNDWTAIDEFLAIYLPYWPTYWPDATLAAAVIPPVAVLAGIALVQIWRLAAACPSRPLKPEQMRTVS